MEIQGMLAKTFKKKVLNLQKYNNTCYIVGGGPSLKGFDWSYLDKNKFIIAINRAYEVLPDAQIVYFTDDTFWEDHKEGLRKHDGYKFRGGLNVDAWHHYCETGQSPAGQPSNQNQQWMYFVKDSIIDAGDVYQFQLTGYEGMDEKWGYLRHGKNSAYAALNLAITHLKFKRIYLLGLDMGWKIPGNIESGTHWHDGHSRIDPESIYDIMKAAYATCIPYIKKYKVRVINVNDNDTLPMFEHIKYDELQTKSRHDKRNRKS